MRTLRKMGTGQNVNVYEPHGAGENVFGISFANLNLLKKQVEVDRGETACKTPEAGAYIPEAKARARGRG